MKQLPHPGAARRALQAGFTLVELVVVMAVLVVLAGLILPKLDTFKLKANKAAAASNIHGVARYITSFKAQKDVFPDEFDSLLDSGTPTNLYTSLDPQCTGSLPGNPTKLTTTTIVNADELRSLNRVGLVSLHHHDAAVEFKGNSAAGTAPSTLIVGDTIATVNPIDPDGQAIIEHFYPGTGGAVPAGKKLAVFGVGPRNKMINDILHEAPFYANTDQNAYYNRFLAVFEFSTGGSRAKLLGVLGSDGDLLSEEIVDYYEG
ncbi:MAG: prepilin-type N-terminal cleavage/methylation domain-containing protein [Planctomycetes bacterium]|nr:prepilin-type N-terminal cleavage/methylation domain-containing protein [Planctomycetota bacterium]